MTTPWLDIPLGDYEAHISMPAVGQAQLMTQQLEALVARYRPASVAVIGCAGGNGFDRLAGRGLSRVIGVDINPRYLEALRQRYSPGLAGLQLLAADIQTDGTLFEPVDLVYAALVLEYVDISAALRTLRRHCRLGGIVVTLTQLPHPSLAQISATPYISLQKLGAIMRLVASEELLLEAHRAGFALQSATTLTSAGGKQFALHILEPTATVR